MTLNNLLVETVQRQVRDLASQLDESPDMERLPMAVAVLRISLADLDQAIRDRR